jgi:maleate isomerase
MGPGGEGYDTTVDGLQKLNDGERGYIGAAKRLQKKQPDIIVYGGTSASMLQPGLGEEIENHITETTSYPSVVTSHAVRNALEDQGIESVAVVTPYIDDVNDRVVNYLETHGIEVVDIDGLGIDEPKRLGEQPPITPYRQAKNNLDHHGADGIFISCTDSRTFEIIEPLEADLNRPVISSNLATLWDTLRTLEVDYSAVGTGSLFTE